MGCGSSTEIKELTYLNAPRGSSPDNLFLKAVKKNDMPSCMTLWNGGQINLSSTDELGNTALHYLAVDINRTDTDPWFNTKNHLNGNKENNARLTPFFTALLAENDSIAARLWNNVVTNQETIFPAALKTNNSKLIFLLLKFHERQKIELPSEEEILKEIESSGDQTVKSLNTKKEITKKVRDFFSEQKPPPTNQHTQTKIASPKP